jgi:SAM-dependent methyltransferase
MLAISLKSDSSRAAFGGAECPLCGSTARLIFRRFHSAKEWFLAHCICGLYFTYPTPTADDVAQFYSGDYHKELMCDSIAVRQMVAKFRRYVDRLKQHFPSGRSLDVGCTTGLFPYLMQQSGYEAEGVEISSETARWGAMAYRIPIWVGGFDDFEDPGRLYDIITMTDVVEHTRNPLQTLKKINQLLRLGGGAMITFPDIASAKSRYYRCVAQLMRRDWLWVTCGTPAHIWEFTRPVAVRCFEAAGFALRSFERTEVSEEPFSGKLALISLGARAFNLPLIARSLGTQMEFVLEKVREVV